MAPEKRQPAQAAAASPSTIPTEVESVARLGHVWKPHSNGSLLTLALGKGICARLQAAFLQEKKIRDAGPNELFASFLYHGLVHFEREFPLREKKAKAKQLGTVYIPPAPTGRVEKLKQRMDNMERWLLRVRDVLEALERGDSKAAIELAKESIAKNQKLFETAANTWRKAAQAMSAAEKKKA